MIDTERRQVVDRLRAVELRDGMSAYAMLSAICRAVMPCRAWRRLTCNGLREYLILLIGGEDEKA